MKQIEKTISPLIDSLFPSFYQDEGENFVAFIKAYYEWLEQNFQIVTLEDNTGFVKDGRITQQNVTGTIYSIINGDLLVKVDSNETFKCFNICSELIPVTTVNAGTTYSTYILRGGTSRRLGSIFISRNLLDYRDIDETIDLFVVFFKEKYLKNIEFDTATNKTLLVKNALDLYRAKGTERAIDLFFRLIYGVKPEVEYPADVLFQPSGAEWVKPTYLEISPNTVDRAITLVGKEIAGVTSGAKAFVEKYVKLRVNNGYSHVLFVSNIKGNFVNRELLIDDQLYSDSPVIYGSLKEIIIKTSSGGFEIGDIVPITTSTGISALAKVTATKDASGKIEFELTEEGYGYSTSSSLSLVSDNLIRVSNVVSGNIISTISVREVGSGYSNGSVFEIASAYGKAAQGIIITNAAGQIESVEVARQGSGFNVSSAIFAAIPGGSAGVVNYVTTHPTKYYELFDTIKQQQPTTIAEGRLISELTKITLTVLNPTGAFPVGSRVYQVDPEIGEIAGGVIAVNRLTLAGGTIDVTGFTGRFRINQPINVIGSDAIATLSSVSFDLPVEVTSGANTFKRAAELNLENEFTITSLEAGFTSTTSTISSGNSASFNVETLQPINQEVIYVNTDSLANTLLINKRLNSATFELPYRPSSNLQSNIFGALTLNALTVGEIRSLSGINPGSGYTQDPAVLLYQPYVTNFDYNNLVIRIASDVSFKPNEILQQTSNVVVYEVTVNTTAGLRPNESVFLETGGLRQGVATVKLISNNTVFTIADEPSIAVGYLVKSDSNSAFVATVSNFRVLNNVVTVKGRFISQTGNDLLVKRMNFNNNFTVGANVVGLDSTLVSNIIDINEDTSSRLMGYNASVTADAVSANGEIELAQIVDSGFGYSNNQSGSTIIDNRKNFTYTTIVDGLGTGSGSYRSLKGFLSDLSKLHDGDFYQEYSYNIMSSISFERYAEMFKKTLHTSGTRFFGSILLSSVINDTQVSVVSNTQIDISNTSPFVILVPALDAAPVPWNSTSVDAAVRLDDEPVEDFRNINIEIRE